MSPKASAALLTIIYLIAGLVWIFISDRALLEFAGDSALLTTLQTYKGASYVLATAVLLYVLTYMALKRERRLSQDDALTHLLNRHMFRQQLDSQLLVCKDNDKPLVLMLLNIDDFKQINSNVNMHAGDEFLKSVADQMREQFQRQVILGRISGDEFAVVLPGAIWPEDVLPEAEQMQERIRHIQVSGLPELQMTACVGISLYPADGESSKELISAASLALDEAKARGPGSISSYQRKLQEAATQRARLLLDLKAAIANRELSVVYQPQFSASTQRVTGVEVLVRWQHQVDGTIGPAEFIPLAEQHGLICGITDYVMQTAIEELIEADLLYTDIHRVSFNVSAADFNADSSEERFAKNLGALPGDWSVAQFELTETAAMLNMPAIRKVLNALTARGVQVSLDDFGTGYSSLSTLRQLRMQELKVDQSFIADIANNPNDAQIVRTILAMAKALNLRVIAEGVETSSQANFLIKEGCQELQGYLYARPMNIDQLVGFMKNHKKATTKQS
ncbi:hypothetical protein IDSA_05430 [Pseudidiomarina salinarum]|uniref:Diguanylate cyclase n=1 Tax=Pseudidiomarina salinarum TaxID=435908 RepID=A0A094JHT7_9GAMM|nr:bifunctional diguanylate cyclase/phosphodiesterase [Pseudidiomarina salinarum]KFZ32111.1 hypothetical protein IDSA_05430 [Pseudidiomarina salinarum]RUO70107.1 bifunctional diguanylate cyclase/phosphodiesterase [Pseudidiomarina salinarum]